MFEDEIAEMLEGLIKILKHIILDQYTDHLETVFNTVAVWDNIGRAIT